MTCCDVMFKSAVLQTKIHVYVLLPEAFDSHAFGTLTPLYPFDRKFKVLTLLHGAFDDGSCWIRRTNIEKIADDNGFAVVMPCVATTFYTDMVHGDKWYTFVTEELPAVLRRDFPLSDRREDNYLCGLSMGGYGTMMIGMNHPERFCKLASMSGALNVRRKFDPELESRVPLGNIWGSREQFTGSSYDILAQMERVAASGAEVPDLFQVIGTEDTLYEQNQDFRKKAEELGFHLHYEEVPGGHDWEIWNAYIPKITAWMGLSKQ